MRRWPVRQAAARALVRMFFPPWSGQQARSGATLVSRERGFALLIVLWTLVLLSLLVGALAAAGGGRARVADALRRNAELDAAAEGGVQEAMFHLLDRSRARWPADGRVREVRRGPVVLRVLIETEAGKINPNQAQPALLEALLLAVGADRDTARQLALNIESWRRPGMPVAGGVGNGGALANAYAAAGRDYGPPGQPFESLDELGLVLGMTPALLDRMAPHLTLFRQGDPDPGSADPVVRRALEIAAGGAGGAGSVIDAGGGQGTGQGGGQGGGQGPARDESVVSIWVDAAIGDRHAVRHAVAAGPGEGNAAATGASPLRILALDPVALPPRRLRAGSGTATDAGAPAGDDAGAADR
ncbi:hypothetical protein [Rhizosaccharibacter radicis]|uniref:General secretion pathway protein GspK n=1 Tax=Rhizosaccharibacter radicis TaxID=2782605 RepID=A0ABT1VT52_9PROT|nr:general secretion pathway protein GspK [Acetobacteraceae bacterium KSS12]